MCINWIAYKENYLKETKCIGVSIAVQDVIGNQLNTWGAIMITVLLGPLFGMREKIKQTHTNLEFNYIKLTVIN